MANQQNQQGPTSNRGFASMDDDKQREIASQGGKAAHEFSSEEAREAGRKGGQNSQGGNTGNNGRFLLGKQGLCGALYSCPSGCKKAWPLLHRDVDAVGHHVAVGMFFTVGELVGQLVVTGRQRQRGLGLPLVEMQMSVVAGNGLALGDWAMIDQQVMMAGPRYSPARRLGGHGVGRQADLEGTAYRRQGTPISRSVSRVSCASSCSSR